MGTFDYRIAQAYQYVDQLVGPSQIRHPPSLMLLRRSRPHLPRDTLHLALTASNMVSGLRLYPTHRLRQHGLLVTA